MPDKLQVESAAVPSNADLTSCRPSAYRSGCKFARSFSCCTRGHDPALHCHTTCSGSGPAGRMQARRVGGVPKVHVQGGRLWAVMRGSDELDSQTREYEHGERIRCSRPRKSIIGVLLLFFVLFFDGRGCSGHEIFNGGEETSEVDLRRRK